MEPIAKGVGLLRSHKSWSKINEACVCRILGDVDALTAREICEKYKVVKKDGSLAVTAVMGYMASISRKYAEVFRIGREADAKVLRNGLMERYNQNYETAKEDHAVAMGREEFRKGEVIKEPNFEAAATARAEMQSMTMAYLKILDDADKQEIEEAPQGNHFTANRIQVLMMPKLKQVESRRAIEAASVEIGETA